MRAWLIDLQPLWLYPAYRRLWFGSTLSAIGNHLTVFAVTLQIFTITNNSLAVGTIGLFTGVPSILLAMGGGVLGDRFDRRKIVLIATSLQLLGCASLWIYTLLGGDNIFFLYCMIGSIFLLGAFNIPAGSAILPRLVGAEHLQAAVTLRVFTMHSAMILGPLLGGLLVAKYGIPTLYFFDMCSFGAALYGIACLPSIENVQNSEKKSWAAIKGGLKFIKSTPVVLGAIYVDFALCFFGMPNALFPAINANQFGGHKEHLGLILAAPSFGGLIAMLVSGRLKHLTSPAVAMVTFCGLWALSVISFSLSSSLTISLFLLFFMGAFDSCLVALRSTIIQKATPDAYRARVSALEYIFDNSASQLGNVRAGLIALVFAPHFVALIGGLTTLVLVILVFFLFPAFIQSRQNQNLTDRY